MFLSVFYYFHRKIFYRAPPTCSSFLKKLQTEDKRMAKPGKIPNFKNIYPEADKKVIKELRKSERKMQYQEFDLKEEKILIDQATQEMNVIPSREDSLERLIELNFPFPDHEADPEEQAIKNILYKQLHKAVELLPMQERRLIEDIYFYDKTERLAASEAGVSQKTIHKRKKQILKKLRRLMEKN